MAPIFSISHLSDSDTAPETDSDCLSITSDDLDVPDLELRSLSTCSTETLDDEHCRPDAKSLRTALVPAFVDVVPTYDPVDTTPPVIQSLYRLTADVQELSVSVQDYYADLRSVSPLLSPSVAPRAHVDGGSIATTTERLEYLFSYHEFSPEERRRSVRLKVADDTIHTPTGVGFLKIPCHHSSGFMYVKSFYTPEIPATILSPDSVAKSLDCKGYSTFSNLVNHEATMELVDCLRCDSSIVFALQSIRGLLFTDPLIAPTEAERNSSSLPDGDFIPTTLQVAPSASSVALSSRAYECSCHRRFTQVC